MDKCQDELTLRHGPPHRTKIKTRFFKSFFGDTIGHYYQIKTVDDG